MARLTRLYQAWFRGVLLPEGLEVTNEVFEKYTSLEKNDKKTLHSDRPCSRDFKRAKVPGNPMESPFCFGVCWGVIFQNILFSQVDSRIT